MSEYEEEVYEEEEPEEPEIEEEVYEEPEVYEEEEEYEEPEEEIYEEAEEYGYINQPPELMDEFGIPSAIPVMMPGMSTHSTPDHHHPTRNIPRHKNIHRHHQQQSKLPMNKGKQIPVAQVQYSPYQQTTPQQPMPQQPPYQPVVYQNAPPPPPIHPAYDTRYYYDGRRRQRYKSWSEMTDTEKAMFVFAFLCFFGFFIFIITRITAIDSEFESNRDDFNDDDFP